MEWQLLNCGLACSRTISAKGELLPLDFLGEVEMRPFVSGRLCRREEMFNTAGDLEEILHHRG